MEIKKRVDKEKFELYCEEKGYSLSIVMESDSMRDMAELSYIMSEMAKDIEKMTKRTCLV